jgi:adenylylsulfate kinase
LLLFAGKPKPLQHPKPALVLWLFGLSGAGKTTLAKRIDELLTSKGFFVKRLDGDAVRAGMNSDLGFSDEDRHENIRRSATLARQFSAAGITTVCSFITPLEIFRQTAREIIGDAFCDIFIDCPLEVCASRDPKGLYKDALDGRIKNFTGIGAGFERPANCFLTINTAEHEVRESAEIIVSHVLKVSENLKLKTPTYF